MFKMFEFLGGVMFLVAAVQFFLSPKKALQETYDVLISPSPRIVKGHLLLPRAKEKSKASSSHTKVRSGNSITVDQEHLRGKGE